MYAVILFLVLISIKQCQCWIDCANSKCKVPDIPSSVSGSKVGESQFLKSQVNGKWYATECSVVVEWSEGLHHHEIEAACSSLGSGYQFAPEDTIKNTVTGTYETGKGTAETCYNKDTFFWVGHHNDVKKAKDWDDKGGKIICACDYVSVKDDAGGLSTGDTTCYAKDGFGVANNIECANGCSYGCVDEGKCKCKSGQAQKRNKCFVCTKTVMANGDCGWSIGSVPPNVSVPYDTHYNVYFIAYMVFAMAFSAVIYTICCIRLCKNKENESKMTY